MIIAAGYEPLTRHAATLEENMAIYLLDYGDTYVIYDIFARSRLARPLLAAYFRVERPPRAVTESRCHMALFHAEMSPAVTLRAFSAAEIEQLSLYYVTRAVCYAASVSLYTIAEYCSCTL